MCCTLGRSLNKNFADHTLHRVPSFLIWLASFIKSLRKGVRFSLMYNHFEAKAVAAGQCGNNYEILTFFNAVRFL